MELSDQLSIISSASETGEAAQLSKVICCFSRQKQAYVHMQCDNKNSQLRGRERTGVHVFCAAGNVKISLQRIIKRTHRGE